VKSYNERNDIRFGFSNGLRNDARFSAGNKTEFR
jgi:hypothetical protein